MMTDDRNFSRLLLIAGAGTLVLLLLADRFLRFRRAGARIVRLRNVSL